MCGIPRIGPSTQRHMFLSRNTQIDCSLVFHGYGLTFVVGRTTSLDIWKCEYLYVLSGSWILVYLPLLWLWLQPKGQYGPKTIFRAQVWFTIGIHAYLIDCERLSQDCWCKGSSAPAIECSLSKTSAVLSIWDANQANKHVHWHVIQHRVLCFLRFKSLLFLLM